MNNTMESNMKTICFNTGRKYTAQGQRITATLHDDGVVTFWDHDRRIDGEFTLGLHCQFDAKEVLHCYDSGSTMYRSSKRSWEDGMQMGGCNQDYR
jgi:hypothetical protein